MSEGCNGEGVLTRGFALPQQTVVFWAVHPLLMASVLQSLSDGQVRNTLNCPDGVKPGFPNSLFATLTCKLMANLDIVDSSWTFLGHAGQAGALAQPIVDHGRFEEARETGRLVGCAPHLHFFAGRFRTKAGEAGDWLTHPWNPARSNARLASRTANTQFWRDGSCADLGLFWCLISRTLLLRL